MGAVVGKIISYLLLFFLLPISFSYAQNSMVCSNYLIRDLQPVIHNKKIKSLINDSLNLKNLNETLQFLIKKNTFDIPVDSHGFVVAANVGDHHGGYGQYFWFRDLARIYQGLSAKVELLQSLAKLNPNLDYKNALSRSRTEVRQVAVALVKIAADQDLQDRLRANIQNPLLHLDGNTGYKEVPLIRRKVTPFIENRPSTNEELKEDEEWGHKQNDALAEFGHAVLDAFKRGHLKIEDFDSLARRNLLDLPAYFVRVHFWKMWDVGAWEEKMALRSSSIGLVISFLERFEDQYFGDSQGIYKYLRGSDEQILNHPDLKVALAEANKVLEVQLDLKSYQGIAEVLIGDDYATRKEDTAILHLLWHPSRRLKLSDQLYLAEQMILLERPSGYIRYENDWFLYGAAEAAKSARKLKLEKSIALPNDDGSDHLATPKELEQIIELHEKHASDKNMEPVIDLAGQNLEAQWTLPDAYLTYFYADAYLKTKDKSLLDEALHHGRRMFGMVTGEDAIDSEGNKVMEARIPEAYVPMRVIRDGQVKVIYRVSPNSPLNWAVAETIRASEKLLRALQVQ